MPPEPVPLTFLFNFIKPYGLRVTSTYGGNHVKNSWHYEYRAVDATGTSEQMRKCALAALERHELFKEAFYDPLGKYVKNGAVRMGRIGGHSDHVHLAR